MGLENRVALVTGATGGLGSHIVETFAADGAAVAVHYFRNESRAREIVADLEKRGAKVIAVQADVSDEPSVQAMTGKVLDAFGRIDILVNSAGISRDGVTWKLDSKLWHEVLNTNLTGTFYCTKAVLPSMRENRWGRIVNMTSIVAQVGVPGTVAYAASKSGMYGMMRTTAREVITRGITVNCLALGYFDAGMYYYIPEEIRKSIEDQIPMKRTGTVAEAMAAIRFICSEEAAYMTGHVLDINGGLHM